MRVLAIDMGTGTQDILLFDSECAGENNTKLVMPSATAIAARRIRRAMADHRPLLLTGVVAGGGPCSWALEEFIRGGGTAYATPEAAQTFDDDLDRVRELGVIIVSDDEALRVAAERVILRDLDLEAVRAALSAFEIDPHFDGLALGCLDHGAAPPGVSDRVFRFQHLRRIVEARNDLLAFASLPGDLPAYLTRARAMVGSVGSDAPPVAFMDTGPAAAIGALHDESACLHPERLVLNLGNMHLLGFYLSGRRIASLFEHHTGELSGQQIVDFSLRLISGELTNDEVFKSKGHGAYHADRSLVHPGAPHSIAVTGPQRGKLRELSPDPAFSPAFASPFGDMMISGCFGLLRGFAEVYPWAREAIDSRLGVFNEAV